MVCDLNQQVRTQSDSHALLNALVSEISSKFPSVDAQVLSSEEIVERYGEQFSFKKGFVNNSQVVINRDLATIDTPLHEFGHLYLKVLKVENPKRYVEIINSTSTFKNQLDALSNLYPELTQEDLQEEFFVQNLGLTTEELLSKYGESKKISLFRRLLNRFKSWLVGLTSSIGFSGIALKQVTSFNDILHQVGYEIMSPTFKQYIDPELLNDIKFQKTTGPIETELDLIKTLIVTDNKDFVKSGKNSSTFATQIQELILNNMSDKKIVDGKEVSFLKETYVKDGKLVERNLNQSEVATLRRFINSFFSDVVVKLDKNNNSRISNNIKIVALSDLHEIPGYESLGKNFNGYSHILVKVKHGDLSFFDLSGKPMNGIHNASLSRKNIAGVYISDHEADKLGLSYTSNKVHVAKLQLGVLALRVKSKLENKVKIDNLYIPDLNSVDKKGNIVTQGTYIDEVVNNLQKLASIKPLANLFTGELKQFISSPVNVDEIRGNVETHYSELLSYYLKSENIFSHMSDFEKKKTQENMQSILDLMKEKSKADKLQDLITVLSERKLMIQDPYDTQKGKSSFYDSEVQILHRYLGELLKVKDLYRQDDRFTVGVFKSFTESIARTGNPILDKLFEYMTIAASKVRKSMVEFREKDAKVLSNLITEFRSINPLSFLEEFTFNDARKFFNDFVEYTDAYDPKTGKKIPVKTGRLIQKDSKEYKDLTPKQKEYYEHFNKEADKSLKRLHGEEASSKGFIPIMRKSSGDTAKEIVKTPLRTWDLIKESFNKLWNEGIDNYEYHLENQSSNSSAYDAFIGQHNNPKELKFGSESRLEKLGLRYGESGGLVITDLSLNTDMETDLSFVLNSFVASNIRKSEFDKIQPITDSLKSFLIKNREAFGNISDNSLAMFEDFYGRFVNESMADLGELRSINKIIGVLQSKASMAVLALNFGTDVKNLATGWATNFKEAMFNSFVKEGFNLWALIRAHTLVTTDALKEATNKSILNKLNLQYGLYNMDYQYLTGRQNLETSKSLFKSRNMFVFNRMGDLFNRRMYTAATFIQEGSLDAYSLNKDNNLVYNEKLDKRFYNPDGTQTNLQKMFLKTVKEEMLREGGLDKRGNLLYGHTIKMRNSMKSHMDRIHGSYDADHTSRMKSYAWTKALISLKTYFVDKQRRYIGTGGDSTKLYSENEGKYLPTYDDKGNVIAYDWQAESQEAILASAIMSVKEIFRNKGNFLKTWKSLTPKGKQNMIYLLTDTAMFVLLYAAFSGLFDEEDEDQTLTEWAQLVSLKGALEASSGLGDLGTTRSGDIKVLSTYQSMMEKPFFVTSFWADIMQSLNNLAFSDQSEARQEKDWVKVMDNFPFMSIGTIIRTKHNIEDVLEKTE